MKQAPRRAPPYFDVVAVAASAGGLSALSRLLADLPADLEACIVIVQHVSPQYPSRMAEILTKRAGREVKEASDGDRIAPGGIYVAPADMHLLINPDGTLSLSHSELVHFVRPSADLLFESVAGAYGNRAIVVVLTGSGSDGSFGVQAAKKQGCRVLAQNEASSEFFGMPAAAIATGGVDLVLPLDAIGATIVRLVETGLLDGEV
jgi:two-component system chemotaxis response regulator CheB